MLSSPKTVASHWDALTPFEPSRRTPAGHASPHTPLVGVGVAAATGAEEAQSAIPASPPPVLISERQVMFATAAAGAASQNAATRRPGSSCSGNGCRCTLKPSVSHIASIRHGAQATSSAPPPSPARWDDCERTHHGH